MKQQKGKKPAIVVIILDREQNYALYKNFFSSKGISSQVIRFQNALKGNLSVASNILKQMNPKVGVDNYQLNIPKGINKKTMLMGIDVCHKPRKSIVGIVATINDSMMHYNSQYMIQDKGQELVDEMHHALRKIFTSYLQANGCLPEHIIVYRDGVSEQMRDMILAREVGCLHEVMAEFYNKLKRPKLTVCVVNKRISQKFYLNGQNPAPGTVVDTKLVNKDASKVCYDFFLVSHNCTQGTVTPTHYYVHYDDSRLDKETFEQFTYNLCHAYQNWPGPIKVPAPCMYAHKIAEYALLTKKVGARTQAIANPSDLDALQNLLHFL